MKKYLSILALAVAFVPLTSCCKEDIKPINCDQQCTQVIQDDYTGSSYVTLIEGTWIGDYTITNSVCYDDRTAFIDTFTLVPWQGSYLRMTATDTTTMTLYSDAMHFDDDPTTIWNIRYVNDSAMCISSNISNNLVIRHYKLE